jgi:hypothetical protein
MSSPVASRTFSSVSAPVVSRNSVTPMPAIGLKAAPVVCRHFEQWQFSAYSNASATS